MDQIDLAAAATIGYEQEAAYYVGHTGKLVKYSIILYVQEVVTHFI